MAVCATVLDDSVVNEIESELTLGSLFLGRIGSAPEGCDYLDPDWSAG